MLPRGRVVPVAVGTGVIFLFVAFFVFAFCLFFGSSETVFGFGAFAFSIPGVPGGNFSATLSAALLASSASVPHTYTALFAYAWTLYKIVSKSDPRTLTIAVSTNASLHTECK